MPFCIVEPDEVMVSFDVESLFPSIPIPLALMELENYLLKINIEGKKKDAYLHVAKICMEQNYFQFRGNNTALKKARVWGIPSLL